MLFAGTEFQEIVLKHYGHITHQKGAWISEKDSILLVPKELAYIDLCVSVTPLAPISCECIRTPLELMKQMLYWQCADRYADCR